jgi:hypothetical protein
MKETISDIQFLEEIGMKFSIESLEIVSKLRVGLAEFSSIPKIHAESIHPTDHVETGLGIHHLDSLDLVDLAATIETDSFRLQHDDYKMIAELNSRDGTVRELAVMILGASRLRITKLSKK